MSTFASIVAERRQPGTTLVLEPWVWADEWPSKPKSNVCVGLRLMSEGAKTRARATAAELANEAHPDRDANWVECFNDCLMRQVVALGICDPNDVTRPHELLRYAEAQVSDALSTAGTQYLYEALINHEIATSPNGMLADSSTFARLRTLMTHTDPEHLPSSLRRLLSFVCDELEAFGS